MLRFSPCFRTFAACAGEGQHVRAKGPQVSVYFPFITRVPFGPFFFGATPSHPHIFYCTKQDFSMVMTSFGFVPIICPLAYYTTLPAAHSGQASSSKAASFVFRETALRAGGRATNYFPQTSAVWCTTYHSFCQASFEVLPPSQKK